MPYPGKSAQNINLKAFSEILVSFMGKLKKLSISWNPNKNGCKFHAYTCENDLSENVSEIRELDFKAVLKSDQGICKQLENFEL